MLNALANRKNKALYDDDEISAEPEDVEMAETAELFGNDEEIIYKEVQFSDESDDDTANS